MYNDFIRIKSLDGELKISHKKKDYGLTISTKELVLQRPHVNYHIKLEDIVSIVPFEPKGSKTLTFVNKRTSRNEVTKIPLSSEHFKCYVKQATMHNRSGIFHMGPTQFIMPIIYELLRVIAEYGSMDAIV